MLTILRRYLRCPAYPVYMQAVGFRNDFCQIVSMCSGVGIALRVGRFILMLRKDIIKFGRLTPGVIVGMGVTDFATVGLQRWLF